DTLAKFAKYGFNKSHSAAYGFVSYQTAFLKANYPVEFMAGLLSNEINNTEKISVFVAECQRMGIQILPPDVNRSRLKFAPEEGTDEFGAPIRAIRFGLAAIKNVGEGAMELAVANRKEEGEFESLEDFTSRLDSKTVNKKILESLVRAGAFDFTGEARPLLFHRIETAIQAASSVQKDRNSGQGSLFDIMGVTEKAPSPTADQVEVEEWTLQERLGYEKDLLGFYVTGHPLDPYRMSIRKGKFKKLSQIEQLPESRQPLKFAALINDALLKYTRGDKPKPFSILFLEDFSGSAEVAVFAEAYGNHADILKPGMVVEMKASVEKNWKGEGMRLRPLEFSILEPIPYDPADFAREEAPIEPLELILDSEADGVSDLKRIQAIAKQHRGQSPLRLRVHLPDNSQQIILTSRKYWINATEEAKRDLSQWLAN
ncbi:MAG: DNA polymerase III subunit alpha, partial [Verrucomicrobiota bacterium]